jgi:tetratricopeptide (TPR) repeat protein
LRYLRQIAVDDDLPLMSTALVTAMEDVVTVLAGEEPPPRAEVSGAILIRLALSRAVAWAVREDPDRAEAELALARAEAKKLVVDRQMWTLIAAAHQRAGSAREIEARQQAADLDDPPTVKDVEALVSLGDCYFRYELYDDAATIEAEAWRLASQIDGIEPTVLHKVGRNLAITLTARAGEGDVQRAIELRRAVLALGLDTWWASTNLVELAEMLKDPETGALALARRAATEDPATAVSTLNSLAYRLHQLNRPESALEATLLAVTLETREQPSPAISNLKTLVEMVRPGGVLNLEKRLLEAGLVNHIEDPRDGSRSGRVSSSLTPP